MVRIATEEDIDILSELLYNMYKEIFPEAYERDLEKYREYISKSIVDKDKTTLIDSRYRGFIMFNNLRDPLIPGLERHHLIHIYIKDQYRGGRVYKELYEESLKVFPTGDILGMVEHLSPYNKLLEKRHDKIATIYKWRR